MGAEAMELFAARAGAARRGFSLTVSNRATVKAICSALDGLPLAIELAAARCDHMTLDEIHEQLDHRFALLGEGLRNAAPRHQGLARAIDWSWDLLGEQERMLLARASVFSDGWTADAAFDVCAVESVERSDVASLLGALVRKSLVVARLDAERARYRMLDSVRAYAADRLVERGEQVVVARRHAEWVAAVLTEIANLLMSSREADGATWRDGELGNLTSGLAWALDHGGLDLAMRCLRPVLWVGHQLPLLDNQWSNDTVIGWRDHPDAAYLWLRTARRARNPDVSRDAAFECGRHDDAPLHIRTLAHVNAIRIRRSTGWISDTTENLTELRRLAEGSQDPRVRFHLAWGEFLATAYGSDERKGRAARLRSEAEATALSKGSARPD